MSKRLYLTAWATVVLIAIAAFVYVCFDIRAARNAAISAANEELLQAIADGQSFVANPVEVEGDIIERRLSKSLENEKILAKDKGLETLSAVRTARTAIEDAAKLRRAKQEAESILVAAKMQFDNQNVKDGIRLLKDYLKNSHATKIDEAKSLLAQASTSTSDQDAFDMLVSLDEAEFLEAELKGRVVTPRVTYAGLIVPWKETVDRNISRARKQRADNQLAEERRRENERIAELRKLEVQKRLEKEATETRIAQEKRRTEEQRKEAQLLLEQDRKKAVEAAEETAVRITALVGLSSSTERRELNNAIFAIGNFRKHWEAGTTESPECQKMLREVFVFQNTMLRVLELNKLMGDDPIVTADGRRTDYNTLIKDMLKVIAKYKLLLR